MAAQRMCDVTNSVTSTRTCHFDFRLAEDSGRHEVRLYAKQTEKGVLSSERL